MLIEPITALQCSVSLVTLIRGLAALLDCLENRVIVTWDYGIFATYLILVCRNVSFVYSSQ